MACKMNKVTSFSVNSETPSSPNTPRGSFLRRGVRRMFSFVDHCRREHSVCNRRSFRRDVEEELQSASNPPCLTSYYSVFVVRLAIMIMLAILIGMLTLLTWHFTRVYTKRSLNTLAYGLRHELLQRPLLRMWNIVNSTVEIATAQVKLSEYIIRKYSNPVNQAQQVEQLYEVMRDMTWALFASRKALNSITISYKNGFVQAFHRDHRSDNTYYIYSDLTNYSISATYGVDLLAARQGWNDQSIRSNISAIWYRAPLDPSTGDKIGKSTPIPPDELINIAGISQVPDATATWHVAVSKYSNSPLLSAALPVNDPTNKSIVAVVGVTTALYSVGQFMKELVEVHSGHIYLTSQEGWLLATSSNTPLLVNTSSGVNLIMAVDSKDPVIRSGAECLQKEYGNKFPPNNEVHLENTEIGQQLYYIDSFFLNLKRLPMVGVIIIPRKYIMGKVDEKALKTLVVLISAAVCILIIGCICIFLLTNGVSKEMKLRAELISHLDARRKAEASSNYKSQFLANMSHELRTPMAAVIGLLDILISDDCLTNEQYGMVTQIRRCSNALLRLLNNILDLSKVESGKLVLEETEFDLSRELEGLVDMFSVQCINHNLEIILDLSDDMPRLVHGDSARVVQVFANLISNSIKFTNSGYIILRGWCENLDTSVRHNHITTKLMESLHATKIKPKQRGSQEKTSIKKDNKLILCFEVDDTGCGIDPSKWEHVFESFEQADPSTTRLHGGTGLGLCIVRNLVKKMGGEIKVMKKNGPGTLMRLYLLLGAQADGAGQHCEFNFKEHNLSVLLALNGGMGRFTTSEWLQKNGAYAWLASDWNELTQTLQELFNSIGLPRVCSGSEVSDVDSTSIFVIVIDIGFLDWSTNIWKEQLKFLEMYHKKAKFAWILNHDTSNNIKMELRQRGYEVMVNKPLYKAKMIQILEAVSKDKNLEIDVSRNANVATVMGDLHESLEIDVLDSDTASSGDSDRSESDKINSGSLSSSQAKRGDHKTCSSQNGQICKRFLESNQMSSEDNASSTASLGRARLKWSMSSTSSNKENASIGSNKSVSNQKTLEGVRILLAEDTPVLQRVATIMLEKLGAVVAVVGDGLQAVEALKDFSHSDKCSRDSLPEEKSTRSIEEEGCCCLPYDLVLMDCQMPKMDGYEATKAIREAEEGTGIHVPIVALTAHAMSSDEAKCLKVGMDAYLTKPIDCKLMVSTILSLTKKTA
ncbi:histidine kinase receptor of two-component system [Lithospermum erythrorhizon]|uniref:histidine kinase n=1 Tax=Lithospermum erythrorhizon TaxID=34254 RepID=A0AAV3NKU0_LITER